MTALVTVAELHPQTGLSIRACDRGCPHQAAALVIDETGREDAVCKFHAKMTVDRVLEAL